MDIEFDPEKRALTLAERGLDFLEAPLIFAGDEFTANGHPGSDGEPRLITYGTLQGRSIVVVWTWRGDSRRIISMRYAHEEELRHARNRMD